MFVNNEVVLSPKQTLYNMLLYPLEIVLETVNMIVKFKSKGQHKNSWL